MRLSLQLARALLCWIRLQLFLQKVSMINSWGENLLDSQLILQNSVSESVLELLHAVASIIGLMLKIADGPKN